ncbi:MAG: LamG-like jellyroll fold domain-containing protein, partial [Planctomycetota bacterium]
TWLRPSTDEGFPELQANYCRGGFGWTPANVVFRAARKVRFERCVFKHLGAMGLELAGGSQDCVVAGCVFTDISATPVKIGGVSDPRRDDARARDTGNTVTNCYIHHSPCEYRGGVGIFAGYVADLTVAHNEICWTPYSAVSVGWGWGKDSYARNNRIIYNDFHHWVRDLSDGGAIYSLSAQPGSAWHHNYGHDVPWGDGHMKRGWYTDEGSAYIDIHHNVIARIARAHWYSAWTKTIHDNKIRDNFTDTPTHHNKGTNCPMTNNVLVKGGKWPQAARDIMNAAGIEADWSGVRDLPCACAVTDPDPAAPPRLTSVRALSATQVEVGFSEAVERSSAQTARNFSLSSKARVVRSARGADPSAVVLTTSELAAQTTYTLTVAGVRDVSSPPKSIARDSRLQFCRRGSLLGWWKFDEEAGTMAADSSGNGQHATVTGPTWVQGRIGGALELGPEDSVTMDGPSGDMPAFTVAFWMRPRSHVDWNQVLSARGWNRFMFHTGVGGCIYCGVDPGSWTSRFGPKELPAGTLALGVWQHFAFTYDAGAARFYRNGSALAAKTQALAAPWTGFGISNVDGAIDELRIYAKALAPAEIKALASGR